MSRPFLAAFVVVTVLVSIVPVGGVAAGSTDDPVVEAPAVDIDASVADRFRSGTASTATSRVDTEGVLEQPTRNAVYTVICEFPGIGLTDLVEAVTVTRSTVRYHVDVLSDAGLVGMAAVAGSLRVAPAEVDAELAGIMNADAIGTVLAAVAADEPVSVTAVAEATDRAPSTVSHHLSTLEERGIVERDRVGESVVTTLTPQTQTAMAELEKTVPAADD